MFYRIILIPAIVVLVSLLISSPLLAQSQQNAIRLHKEAMALREKARSNEDLKEAVQKYEEALAIFRNIGDSKNTGFVYNDLGIIYADWGQYPKAVEHFEKSLELFPKFGDLKSAGLAQNNLGVVHKYLGQYEKAVECYEKSLELSRKTHDVKTEGMALNNLGEVNRERGQYEKAVEYYGNSLGLFRRLGDVNREAMILNNLGAVYWSWGQYQRAVDHFQNSLELKRKSGDLKGEGGTLHNLGKVYADRGEYGIALANFQKCLEIYLKMGLPSQVAKRAIGHLYLDKGEFKMAEPFVKESGSNELAARFHLVKSDFVAAEAFYDIIRQSAERNRNADALFIGYTGLGLACEGRENNSSASAHFRRAIEHTEELRAGLREAERWEFYSVRVGGFYRTAPYEGLARVHAKMNQPVEALKNSEYTKARVFAEGLSRRSERGVIDVPKRIISTDSELNEQLAGLTKSLQKGYEKQNKEIVTALEPQVKQAKTKLAAHIDTLRKQYPFFAATKYPEPMDLSLTALRADEWTLAYDVTDPGLIIYLTKGKELKKALFKPIPRKKVDDLVKKFRQPFEDVTTQNMAQKLRDFDFAAGKQLADLLLSDVLPEIPNGAPLIVVPDDSLGAVPFEMLVLNQGASVADNKGRPNTTGAEFLGDRNPISYYQSITALTLARNFGKQKGAEAKRLVMSDPIFDSQDQRLKDLAAQKKQTLIKALPQQLMSIKQENKLEFLRLPATGDLGKALKDMDPAHTELCMGFEASKPALFKKPLDKYGSVVFATHGYFGKELAGIQEPVLVLTLLDQPKDRDGFLRLSEVMGLKLNADIVALTACQTGLGRQISGEGTMGMGRAFQYAGAKSVLMSLWSVSEASSVKLVESFFKHMKAGKSKLEALKQARDEIRKAGYDHPFYWAPFILVGEVQ